MTVPDDIIVKIIYQNGEEQYHRLSLEGTEFNSYEIDSGCLSLIHDKGNRKIIPLIQIMEIDIK